MAERTQFSEMLASYDQERLRAAFEAVGDHNRTTLTRWITGTSVPQRGAVVRRLAEELGDPELYRAWESAKQTRASGSSTAVTSAFERLSPEDRDTAFHEIREHYVADGKPERNNFTYEITVTDPPADGGGYFVLRVDFSWDGSLPANAWCAWVTDQSSLSAAYDEPDCLFRELVDFDRDALPRLFEKLADEQVLAYNPLGGLNPMPVTHRTQPDQEGIARFDNAAVDRARITLSLSYPIPKGTPMFVIKLGDYAVPGPATAKFTLASRSASRPRAMAFLAPGRQKEWATNQIRPNELFISLGTAATVLGEGDGLVLSWTVSS